MALEIVSLTWGMGMSKSGDAGDGEISLRYLEQIDSICLDFERGWRNGSPSDLTLLLAGASSDVPRPQLFRELLRIELAYRRQQNSVLAIATYRDRFPEFSEVVAEVFAEFMRDSSVPVMSAGSTVPQPIQGGLPADPQHVPASKEARNQLPAQNELAPADDSRYKIVRSHAKGGLGEVFVALDSELNREVALKEIQPQFAGNEESRVRFRREAEITGNLEHPGIVPVYGLGHHTDGRPYYAMRFIRGESLKEAIEQYHARFPVSTSRMTDGDAALELRKLLGRFVDVCNAMEYSHSRGVLHRDLKPGNVVLGKYGETLVVDWGLAKAVGITEQEDASLPPLQPTQDTGATPTIRGSAIGTPAYMSPEQAAGEIDNLGPATDVYSLGATLYHLLTGQRPFSGTGLIELLDAVKRGSFPRPREIRADLPRPLEAICLKAMSRKISDRYGSPLLLAEELERWLADEPVHAYVEPTSAKAGRFFRKHRAWALSGATALALLAIAATISAFLINGQKEIIAAKERNAIKLALANAALADDKTKLADEKSALAKEAVLEREKADRAAASAMAQSKLAQRRLYIANMNVAQAALNDGDVNRAQYYLDSHGEPTDTSALRGFEWHYLYKLIEKENYTLLHGITDRTNVDIAQLHAMNKGGGLVYLDDQVATLWNDPESDPVFTKMLDAPSHHRAAFDADGSRLAIVTNDRIEIWNTLEQSANTIIRTDAPYSKVLFNPTGTRLAAVAPEVIVVWDANTGKRLFQIDAHNTLPPFPSMGTVEFSPDGNLIAQGLIGVISLWDSETGRRICSFGESDSMQANSHLRFSPDCRQLATLQVNGRIKVWDIATEKEAVVLGGDYIAKDVQYSPNGKWIASSQPGFDIRLWDATTGQQMGQLIGHSQVVEALAFSADSEYVASASRDRTIRIWRIGTNASDTVLKGPWLPAKKLCFSRDGTKLFSADNHSRICFWDAINPLKEYHAINTGPKGTDLSDGSPIQRLTRIAGRNCESDELSIEHSRVLLSGAAFSHDGSHFASASADDFLVRIWDNLRSEPTKALQGGWGPVVFGPDTKWVAASNSDSPGIRMWDVSTGQVVKQMDASTGWILSLAINPKGDRLLSGSARGEVGLWDVDTGQERTRFIQPNDPICDVCFSPDGRRFASGSLNGAVRVWDIGNGDLKGREIFRGNGSIASLSFSPDGSRLACTESGMVTITLLDVDAGVSNSALVGHADWVYSVAFSPDGERIASGSRDGGVKVWDLVTEQETLSLKGPRVSGYSRLLFSPDGRKLTFGGTVWELAEAVSNDASVVDVSNAVHGRNSSDSAITSDTTLDPTKSYDALVIRQSGVTIDGRGAWLIGPGEGATNKFQGTAIIANGVSNVTLKNINAKGWETGLKIRDGSGWTIENCNFSDNFHDPEFGWGENGRRGGIVLENVRNSVLRKNMANRVWDGCVLINSDDNLLEENDFSQTSNTCLKLWTSCRNTVRKNVLSHGIRITPGEVHARDSTCVLIESGSNDNRFLDNDCTHGGDGIFVRVLNGWCSTGNHFERNDCSFANNNGVECWAPRNVFVRNKANHCSYGFWLGGSDQTRLIQNEASFNGLPIGHHNSPHLPGEGHAGIVFMFGSSSHTLARGNICKGNNGAGIALLGDLDSQGKKWRAYHWVLEGNTLSGNRWGLYAKHADWVTAAGNNYENNSKQNVFLDGDVNRFTETVEQIDVTADVPVVRLTGPKSIQSGMAASWDASTSHDPGQRDLAFSWNVGDGQLRVGPKLEHTFGRVGLKRIGLNVSNGRRTELAWRDVYVVRDVTELGTEGQAAQWFIEDFHDRTRSDQQASRADFQDDSIDSLVGKSALRVVIEPYAGFRAALTYPKERNAAWSPRGKTKLSFWVKAINASVTGWQGGPFITLHGDGENRCYLEPQTGRDLMRELDNNEAREGWRLFEIPLQGGDLWKRDGELPATIRALSLAFDSWDDPTLRIWIDGLALE